MSKIILPLHSYAHRASQISSRRLVNCYPEQVPLPGKAPIALLRSPGVEDWITLPTYPIRGMLKHQEVLHVVSGKTLYSVLEDGTATALGTILGTGLTPMATNGQELIVINEPDAYILSEGTLAKISDDDFTVRGASDVDTIDSFMIYIEPNSGRAFASEFLDAGNVDPLDFGTAEAAPDNLVAVLVDHRQIFLFGVDTIELWYNSGAAGFPFLREQNGFIECGCGAKNSPVKADNTVFWLDDKRMGRKLSDMTPQRVTTHAIEQRWQDYSRVDDAYSVAYIHEGHTFWCLTFPTVGESWEFDVATGEWHERSSRLSNGGMGPWRIAAQDWCYGSNIVGDSRSGKLGKLKSSVFTEWGDMQRFEFTFPNIYREARRMFLRRLEIGFQAGVGLTVGQGQDPQCMLYLSNNGGVTFEALPSHSIGRIGEYNHRAVWSRLGTGDDIVFRGAVSDPVIGAVIEAQLEVEGGRL